MAPDESPAKTPQSRSRSRSHPRSGPGPSYDILTCTVRNPPFSYIQLELQLLADQAPSNPDSSSSSSGPDIQLDALQVKSFCTSALRQFLGLTGAAIPLDILKVHGRECWLRVPRQDLGSFAAAVTAWRGTLDGGVLHLLRLKKCSDFLGTMVGSDGQEGFLN
ncbi:hypothetical protein ESCO_000557 [Escovopsis weberi]|uniref:Ribonucleases P/MRP subunit Pop8-like domain-containing protein n=1 Tax=Escovopsis weberi TaxID=150374 RepID=A0A0M8MUK8_ESCWE|nr:hypothetical protein ESCO_000557 [Escovopsis weberi]